ncbi:hypothetical protein N7504_000069 [Penicillium tannophilum]|nr:hypothetical protein N7504_000069 [Penicillium tannophilum]
MAPFAKPENYMGKRANLESKNKCAQTLIRPSTKADLIEQILMTASTQHFKVAPPFSIPFWA